MSELSDQMLLSGDPAPSGGLNAVSVGWGCVLTVCGVSVLSVSGSHSRRWRTGLKTASRLD